MILYILGGATVALFNIFLQLADDSSAFSIDWRYEFVSLVAGLVFGLSSSLAMTGAAAAWPSWTHYAVGLFAGAVSFIAVKALKRWRTTAAAL